MRSRPRPSLAAGALCLSLLVAAGAPVTEGYGETPLLRPAYEPSPDDLLGVARRISDSRPLTRVATLAGLGAEGLARDTLSSLVEPFDNHSWGLRVASRLAARGHLNLAMSLASMSTQEGLRQELWGPLVTGYASTELQEVAAKVLAFSDSSSKAALLALLAEAYHRRGEEEEALLLAKLASRSISTEGEGLQPEWLDVARALALVGELDEAALLAGTIELNYRWNTGDPGAPDDLYKSDGVAVVAQAWAAAGDPNRAIRFVNRATDCNPGLKGFICRLQEHVWSGERKGMAATGAAREFARAGDRRSFFRVARLLPDSERLDISMLLADRLLDRGLVAEAAKVARDALERSARWMPGQVWHARIAPELPRRLVALGEGDLGRRLAIASNSGYNYATSFGLRHLLEQARANIASAKFMPTVVRGLGLYGGGIALEAEEVLVEGVAATADGPGREEALIESVLALAALGRTEAATRLLAAAEAIPLEERGNYYVGSRAGRIALAYALLGSPEVADEKLAAVLYSQQGRSMAYLSATLNGVGEATAWYGIPLGPKTRSALADILRRFEGCGHWEEMASGLTSALICPQPGLPPTSAEFAFDPVAETLAITGPFGAFSFSIPTLDLLAARSEEAETWMGSPVILPEGMLLEEGYRSTFLVWPSGARVVLAGAEGYLQHQLVDPKGEWMATWTHRGVQVWRLAWAVEPSVAGEPPKLPGTSLEEAPASVGVSEGGDYLFLADKEGLVRIWDMRAPELGHETIQPGLSEGRFLAQAGPTGHLFGVPNEWVDLLVPGAEPQAVFRAEDHGGGRSFVSNHLPTGTLALETGTGLEVWRNGEMLDVLEYPPSTSRLKAKGIDLGVKVAWGPGGERMLVLSSRHLSMLWDIGSSPVRLDAMAGSVSGGAISPDGRWLVVQAGGVRVWDLSSLTSIHD
ncbi:hypothetical protein IIA16_00405 [bacterium]|nr:hypothetical protein [bacterium]